MHRIVQLNRTSKHIPWQKQRRYLPDVHPRRLCLLSVHHCPTVYHYNPLRAMTKIHCSSMQWGEHARADTLWYQQSSCHHPWPPPRLLVLLGVAGRRHSGPDQQTGIPKANTGWRLSSPGVWECVCSCLPVKSVTNPKRHSEIPRPKVWPDRRRRARLHQLHHLPHKTSPPPFKNPSCPNTAGSSWVKRAPQNQTHQICATRATRMCRPVPPARIFHTADHIWGVGRLDHSSSLTLASGRNIWKSSKLLLRDSNTSSAEGKQTVRLESLFKESDSRWGPAPFCPQPIGSPPSPWQRHPSPDHFSIQGKRMHKAAACCCLRRCSGCLGERPKWQELR